MSLMVCFGSECLIATAYVCFVHTCSMCERMRKIFESQNLQSNEKKNENSIAKWKKFKTFPLVYNIFRLNLVYLCVCFVLV